MIVVTFLIGVARLPKSFVLFYFVFVMGIWLATVPKDAALANMPMSTQGIALTIAMNAMMAVAFYYIGLKTRSFYDRWREKPTDTAAVK